MEGIWPECEEEMWLRIATWPSALLAQRRPQPRSLCLIARVVGLELSFFPERFEGASELVEDVRHVRLRHLDHPLMPAEERSLRKVGGRRVASVELVRVGQRATPSHADGFGVRRRRCGPRRRGGRDGVDSVRFGGARVGRGQQPQPAPSLARAPRARSEGSESQTTLRNSRARRWRGQ